MAAPSPGQLAQHGARQGAAEGSAGGGRQTHHLQMCKKIAQLTKIIYALNTKNDEQEASIQALKEAHQEEIHHILTETRETVLHYKKKVEEEQELRQRTHTTEEALAQHRRLNEEDALAGFATCRKQEEQREPPAESPCTEKNILLPKQVPYRKLCSKNGVETSNQESGGLLNERGAFDEEVLNIKGYLNEMGSMDIRALISKTETLKWENQKLAEEYAKKASQLQASLERDKEAWRKAMQHRDAGQRKNVEAHEAASQQQMRATREAGVEARGQCLRELNKHAQKLLETMQDLELQLKEAQQVVMESKRTMKALEEELIIAKERLLMQENEILQKTEAMQTALDSQSKATSEVGNQLQDYQQELSRKQRPRGKDLQSHDVSVQPKPISKQHKDRTKYRVQLAAPSSIKSEEKWSKMNAAAAVAAASRPVAGGALQEEAEQNLAGFQREKAEGIHALREEWSLQKAELQAQVTYLKQTLEQQASTFREALREKTQQSGKEKEKLLQKLQDTVNESQDIKTQLEASHQTAINLLEKNKNRELKEAEYQWKKDSNESFKAQQASYRQELQTLEEKAREALRSELEKIQQQPSLLRESLRVELLKQRESCITHQKEKEAFQEELRHTMLLKRQQEGNNQDQIQSFKDELVKCQKEICGLKKDNSPLKGTVDLLRVDAKQASAPPQEPEGQLRRYQELEETPRKNETRSEDTHLISCLQEKLSEKEEMIKELMDRRKHQPSFLRSTEPRRNQSCSFNMNPSTCLAPIAKQKKTDSAPSRIVSVPNLASYAKSFLSGDLRPKRNMPPMTKSTRLEQNPGRARGCAPPEPVPETKSNPRLQGNEMAKLKDPQKQDPQPQEWFTKYFSF